jgi:hypothetical protein
MDVQAVIVPGVGVAACQAGVDNTRDNQMLVYAELKKGTPPAQIGTLADRVMSAMEAADANGGDHRCNCGVSVLGFVPCDNKTAHVAYITIAEKDDTPGTTHNDGQHFAFLSVTDDNTKAGESGGPSDSKEK